MKVEICTKYTSFQFRLNLKMNHDIRDSRSDREASPDIKFESTDNQYRRYCRENYIQTEMIFYQLLIWFIIFTELPQHSLGFLY